MSERRTRKRLATRQIISDAATRLIMERGFDKVTIDAIAEAADVGRMTVFNHFPRKEDMFFDREQEIRDLATGAIRERAAGVSPIEALRLLAHRFMDDQDTIVPLSEKTFQFVQTALASEALKSRARQMRDDLTREMTGVMAEAVGRPADDPQAHLIVGLLVGTWSVAFDEGWKALEKAHDDEVAKRAFLTLIDQGFGAASAAMADTPYSSATGAIA